MTLAGIWHGAGFQFLLFGLMHAIYLTINQCVAHVRPEVRRKSRSAGQSRVRCLARLGSHIIAVLAAQVMFRASSVGAAFQMLAGMIGLHGVDPLPVPSTVMTVLRHLGPMYTFLTQTHHLLAVPVEDSIPAPASLALLFFIVWALPNSQTIMAKFSPTLTAVKSDSRDGFCGSRRCAGPWRWVFCLLFLSCPCNRRRCSCIFSSSPCSFRQRSIHFSCRISRPTAPEIRLGSLIVIGKDAWLSATGLENSNNDLEIMIEAQAPWAPRVQISVRQCIYVGRSAIYKSSTTKIMGAV